MSLKPLCITSLFAFCIVAGSAANAQLRNPRQLDEGEIFIQSQRNITLRPSAEADLQQHRDDAVRMIYRMADRECALVLETIGATCALSSISTSVTSGEDNPVQNPVIRVSGSFSMRVKLKS